MAELVNITAASPKSAQIWGFHEPCDLTHVASAVEKIASGLAGAGHTIHIMSGTHGYCDGKVGAPASRERRFREEDRSLARPKTRDGKPVSLKVHDFNNGSFKGPDRVTAAMASLNTTMRQAAGNDVAHNSFLLAYCCSAGTR